MILNERTLSDQVYKNPLLQERKVSYSQWSNSLILLRLGTDSLDSLMNTLKAV